jgi:hypothetical protein
VDYTAAEARRYLEEYLDARIRIKPEGDRTAREGRLLELLTAASNELLQQERVKQQEQTRIEAEADHRSEQKVAELLRILNRKNELSRMLDPEGGK